ncbi:MAG: cysteine desulfurase family protein [Myxococcota bacterium]|nr:cysteine desulfurase family protein [Myxococcota bacterium]
MPTRRIYLDHNASAPLRTGVRRALRRLIDAHGPGNPSSIHVWGRAVRDLVERSRESFAALVGAAARDLVLTSGGTEGNNLAILGTFADGRGGHVVTTMIEHPSVLEPARLLESRGVPVTRVSTDAFGRLDPDDVVRALRPDTRLVSISWANHEIGTVQPVREIAALLRRRGIPLHVDATQAVGRIPVDLRALDASMASFSGHKIGALPGAGFLYAAPDAPASAVLLGGGQERRMRAGTENVPGAVALGAAAEEIRARLDAEIGRMRRARDAIERALLEAGFEMNGHPVERLPNTLSVRRRDLDGGIMVVRLDLDGVAIGAGSACSSGTPEPSRVVAALFPGDPDRARGTIRISTGPATSLAEARDAAARILAAAGR